MRVRTTALEWAFGRLYSRFAFAYELVGRIAFGAAWDGRRDMVVSKVQANADGFVLEIGCGEGRLLDKLQQAGVRCIGVDPSPQMVRRAGWRSAMVVRGRAQSLPIGTGMITTIVSTYPGSWIIDDMTQSELFRVSKAGADLYVLLGGEIDRGRGVLMRRALARVVYGRRTGELPPLAFEGFVGSTEVELDRWGSCYIWNGYRLDQRAVDGRSISSSSS